MKKIMASFTLDSGVVGTKVFESDSLEWAKQYSQKLIQCEDFFEVGCIIYEENECVVVKEIQPKEEKVSFRSSKVESFSVSFLEEPEEESKDANVIKIKKKD